MRLANMAGPRAPLQVAESGTHRLSACCLLGYKRRRVSQFWSRTAINYGRFSLFRPITSNMPTVKKGLTCSVLSVHGYFPARHPRHNFWRTNTQMTLQLLFSSCLSNLCEILHGTQNSMAIEVIRRAILCSVPLANVFGFRTYKCHTKAQGQPSGHGSSSTTDQKVKATKSSVNKEDSEDVFTDTTNVIVATTSTMLARPSTVMFGVSRADVICLPKKVILNELLSYVHFYSLEINRMEIIIIIYFVQ